MYESIAISVRLTSMRRANVRMNVPINTINSIIYRKSHKMRYKFQSTVDTRSSRRLKVLFRIAIDIINYDHNINRYFKLNRLRHTNCLSIEIGWQQ